MRTHYSNHATQIIVNKLYARLDVNTRSLKISEILPELLEICKDYITTVPVSGQERTLHKIHLTDEFNNRIFLDDKKLQNKALSLKSKISREAELSDLLPSDILKASEVDRVLHRIFASLVRAKVHAEQAPAGAQRFLNSIYSYAV